MSMAEILDNQSVLSPSSVAEVRDIVAAAISEEAPRKSVV